MNSKVRDEQTIDYIISDLKPHFYNEGVELRYHNIRFNDLVIIKGKEFGTLELDVILNDYKRTLTGECKAIQVAKDAVGRCRRWYPLGDLGKFIKDRE